MEMAARMKEEQLISNQTNIIGAKKAGVYLWVPMTGGVLSFFAVVSDILKNCWNLSIKRQWVFRIMSGCSMISSFETSSIT